MSRQILVAKQMISGLWDDPFIQQMRLDVDGLLTFKDILSNPYPGLLYQVDATHWSKKQIGINPGQIPTIDMVTNLTQHILSIKKNNTIIKTNPDSLNFSGGVTITSSGNDVNISVASGSGGGNDILVKDEGNNISNQALSLNFIGSGVSSTSDVNGNIVISIPGTGGSTGNPITVLDEGVSLTNNVSSLNFIGGGVSASGTTGAITINIPSPPGGGGVSSFIQLDDVPPTFAGNANKVLVCNGSATGLNFEDRANFGGNLIIQEDGTLISNTVSTLNFTGAGVTTSGSGNNITINIDGGGGGGGSSGSGIAFRQLLSGNNSQISFTLNQTVDNINNLMVFVNNVIQNPNDNYILTNSTTLQFTSAPILGTDNILVISLGGSGISIGSGISFRQLLSGNNSQTSFTLNQSVGNINNLVVFVNNVIQKSIDNYILPNSNTLQFTSSPSSGTNNILVICLNSGISFQQLLSGNNSQTSFTLNQSVNSINNIMIFVNNVMQKPTENYTLSDPTTLSFTTAPLTGTNNIIVISFNIISLRQLLSGNNSQTSFTLNQPVENINNILVFVNNVIQNPISNYILINPTTLQFTSAPASGTDDILVLSISGNNGSGLSLRQLLSGNNSQTSFLLNQPVSNINNLIVFVNDVIQNPISNYTLSDPSILNFITAPASGTDNIIIYIRDISFRDLLSGNNSQTSFGLNQSVSNINNLLVFVNDVIQNPISNYTLINPTTLNFTSAPTANTDNILIIYLIASFTTISVSNTLIIKDEGVNITSVAKSINFVGNGVISSSDINGNVNVSIPGSSMDKWFEQVNSITANNLSPNTNAICSLQSIGVSPGNLIINGGDASNGSVIWENSAFEITLTSSGNLSSIVFTITGIDQNGNSDSESINGPNNNTVTSTKIYTSITQVSCNLGFTSPNISVGKGTGKVIVNMNSGNCFYIQIPTAPLTIRIVGTPRAGTANGMVLMIKQDSSARVITWESDATLIWDNGIAPSLAGNNMHEKYVFQRFDADINVITSARIFKEG